MFIIIIILQYIHDCLSHYDKPLLVLVPFDDLVKVKSDKFVRPVYGQQSGIEKYVIYLKLI